MIANWINRFNARLDELLKLAPKSTGANNPQNDPAFQVAEVLSRLDFDTEISPKNEIESRWMRQVTRSHLDLQFRSRQARRWPVFRPAWVPILIILLTLLAVFRQPVFAAVSRAFGYIFVPDVGFLPMDATFLLKQPILQEHHGQSLTVTHGIATPQNIVLFLEFNDYARPVDGARLESESGEKFELLHWEYWPNTPDSRGIKMIFPPSLPVKTTQMTLSFPEGWHLPLDWIPASQSNLPDARVVPYASATQESTTSSHLCVEKHKINLCVLAATSSAENTSALVQSESKMLDVDPGDALGFLTWQTENKQVALQDEQGNMFPMSSEQNGMLLFPPLPSNQTVTLMVPALLATVDIPDQNVFLDIGDNPEPDTVIPIDVNIQVLGATVHFSQATFVGDGVNSLRLILNADKPIPTADGLTPTSFELGKPNRVDDLYGSGTLGGSQDIFIELVRPSGKITGMLTIPIVRATVIVEGPFEFNFNLANTSAPVPTPADANPNIFSPATSPTPLSLDDYSYRSQMLKSGDLVFTTFNGKNSDLYTFTPDLDNQPRLVATLPGAVAQIYIHPDFQGLDYLAGIQSNRDSMSYIKNISLYSVSFDKGMPRLLYTFPPTPENFLGPAVIGDWSYDGQYAIFNYITLTPGNSFSKHLWLDMSCRIDANCMAHEVPLEPNLDLSKGKFAPNDYRFLFTGSDNLGTGEMDFFIMNFDPNSPSQNVVNITANSSSSVDDVAAPAVWTPDGKIFALCNDGQSTTRFCYVNPATGQITSGETFTEHITQYQVFPSGQFILGTIINHSLPGKGELEIHKFDLNAKAGPALATSRLFPFTVISPDERFLAYTVENNNQIQVIDMVTSNSVTLYSEDTPNVITWLAWID